MEQRDKRKEKDRAAYLFFVPSVSIFVFVGIAYAEYMIRCYHSGRNPSWTQDVGGHLLRRAAWQQIPSFRNTPVERRTLNNHHRMATFTAPLTLIRVQSALDIP